MRLANHSFLSIYIVYLIPTFSEVVYVKICKGNSQDYIQLHRTDYYDSRLYVLNTYSQQFK